MTRYVGLDVHKRFIEYCILDAAGKKLSRGQTACIRATLEGFATTVLSLDGDLRLLTSIEQELAAIDKLTATKAHQDVQIQLLMTLPGVNFVGAVGLLAALGDITRFKDGDHAAAYLGLTPSTHQSGSRCYHGHITKAGSNHARWLLTQGVQQMVRHPGPLGVFFRRLAKRRNRNVAIVATARKLVTIAFLMLKHNEPYRYAKPELMRRKFRELHYLATGERLPRQSSKRPQGAQ